MKEWFSIVSAVDLAVDWSQIIIFALILFWLYKMKPKWLESVRSILAVMLGYSFCYGFLIKLIEPKDFLLIVSMAFNFYFLVKQRPNEQNKP